MIKFLEM